MAEVTTSLIPNISVCQTKNCRNIVITETTGEYNALTNTGGWSTPETSTNPDSNNVTRVIVEIIDPSDTTYTFDSNEVAPGIIPFPDPTGLEEFVIEETSLGKSSGDKLDDGEYTITVTFYGTIDTDTFTEIVNKKYVFTCQTRCCADSLFHEAAQSDCTDCKKPKIDKALEVDSLLKQVEYATSCGKINMAKKFLAKAQWICNNSNCLNC